LVVSSESHIEKVLVGSDMLDTPVLPAKPNQRTNWKRTAARTLSHIVRPLRAIKPLDWLVSRAFQVWYELPVTPTHFYSPLPDVAALKGNLHRWYREDILSALPMDLDRQRDFLESLAPFSKECGQLPPLEQVTAEGYGLGYGEVEAHFLHCLIRHFKPHKIIEVGSGVSTFYSLYSLEMNRRMDGTDSAMICVEPYPRPMLRELIAEKKVIGYTKEVQDVDSRLFEQLEEGDILFIDSSHTSKVDSDVNFLYFVVLPKLRDGVVVHIHDIPFPYLTCPPGHPMFEKSLLWNEAAVLTALLMGNGAFEVLMCQSYLHSKSQDSIKNVVGIYDPRKHFPSSLWLQRQA
jgi:Methyltransferase domain